LFVKLLPTENYKCSSGLREILCHGNDERMSGNPPLADH